VKEYGDFEMIVDWRITKKGDSGIYLRGSPQVQIWDTSRVEAGAQVGSGGLYNNQVHESKPLVVADNPVGDWNTFRITMIGDKVTVYLNGQLVVDKVVMENYWDRTLPIYPRGSIELQAHGTDLAFRDIYIRELEPSPNALSEEEAAAGFVSLFNGQDLSGWTGENHSYAVEDGTIVIRPTESGGNLYTEKEYSDFIFRFEFKLTPGANNGLGIRTPCRGMQPMWDMSFRSSTTMLRYMPFEALPVPWFGLWDHSGQKRLPKTRGRMEQPGGVDPGGLHPDHPEWNGHPGRGPERSLQRRNAR
jgi:hypothetical protein